MQRLLSLLSWLISVSMVLASGAWLVAGLGWRVDLLANLTAQIGIAALLLMLYWALRRKWRLLVCVAPSAPLLVMALAPGRAERATARDSTVVRALTFNTYNQAHTADRAAMTLDESDADVFTIIEPNAAVVRLLRESGSFRERYPYTWPDRPYAARQTIVSRWPIEGLRLRFTPAEEGRPNPGSPPTGAIIHRPGGSFVLIAAHPPSPRTPESWESGNESIRRLSGIVLDLAQSRGLPIVVGGDFNSTPTGWRSRHFRRQTGLRRGKPWLAPVGSWPNGMVWPARLAIDDVFVSESVRVRSWETLPAAEGGDHSPVLVELLIPATMGSASTDSLESVRDGG